MKVNLGIRARIFVFYLVVALTPLIAVDYIWYHSSRDQLTSSASDRQAVSVSESAQRLSQSMTDKLNAVVTHSQENGFVALDPDQISTSLLHYAYQDSDVKSAAVADPSGIEQVLVQDGKATRPLTDISSSDAFTAIRQVTSAPYVSSVAYTNGQPYVTVSVPILAFNRLGDQQLTEAQALARRYGSDIKGAFIVTFNLQSLFQSVVANRIGTYGYMYIIDSQGNLIAHPDSQYLASHPNIMQTNEVSNALKFLSNIDLASAAASYHATPSVSKSERGVQVLSSNFPIAATAWAIIGEEPVANVYSSAHHISIIALMILLLALPASLLITLLATQGIISPIRELTEGAVRIGNGDFSYQLHIKGKDELGTLARTFTAMAERLQKLIGQYQTQNLKLAAERSKLQAVLNTTTDGIIVLSKDYKIVLVNRMISSLTSLPDVSIIYGKPWLDVLPLTLNDKPLENKQLAGNFTSLDNIILRLTDKMRYLNLTAVRLENDPNGLAYIITVHDITQSRELEAMRLDFVSMAAHELRTPLTAVRGYLELMIRNWSNSEANKKYAQHAIATSDTLGSLINNILSLSRIERNAMKLSAKRLPWSDIVQSEVRNHTFAATAKGLQLGAALPETPVEVMGDELYLREVVGNLISNAIHYTETGGMITVSVAVTGDNIKTTVADTGIGIAPESIGKLFEKYYRTKGGLTTNSQGTGIGLFIVKSIIEAHHGVVGVESVLGHGSQFYFTLPKPPEEAPHVDTTPEHTETQGVNKVEWL